MNSRHAANPTLSLSARSTRPPGFRFGSSVLRPATLRTSRTFSPRLHMMLGALGSSDTLTGLALSELRCLDACVRRTIATLVTPDETLIPNQLPHYHLARWLASTERKHPVELFTVNYDILIELALEREKRSYLRWICRQLPAVLLCRQSSASRARARRELDSALENARLGNLAPL